MTKSQLLAMNSVELLDRKQELQVYIAEYEGKRDWRISYQQMLSTSSYDRTSEMRASQPILKSIEDALVIANEELREINKLIPIVQAKETEYKKAVDQLTENQIQLDGASKGIDSTNVQTFSNVLNRAVEESESQKTFIQKYGVIILLSGTVLLVFGFIILIIKRRRRT